MRRFRLIWVLVLTALLSACNFPTATTTAPPQVVPTSTPALAPVEATSVPTQDPTRYYNTEGGFSLKLPAGWGVSEPLEVANDPARPYVMYLLGAGTDLSINSGPGVSRIILADAAQWNVEQFVLDQCSTCPANPLEAVTLDGLAAQRIQIGGGGVPFMVTWYFVVVQDQLIGFAIHDPETLAPLDDVMQSIQFE